MSFLQDVTDLSHFKFQQKHPISNHDGRFEVDQQFEIFGGFSWIQFLWRSSLRAPSQSLFWVFQTEKKSLEQKPRIKKCLSVHTCAGIFFLSVHTYPGFLCLSVHTCPGILCLSVHTCLRMSHIFMSTVSVSLYPKLSAFLMSLCPNNLILYRNYVCLA